jgi:endonuclease YncB( thermonuclease family)
MRFFFLLLFLLSGLASAEPFAARVVAVESGDMLEVLDEQRRRFVVSLAAVAAPDRTQPFGPQARAGLSALIFNREVAVSVVSHESASHVLATVLAADPNCNAPACVKIHDVGLMQVSAGYAWWDRHAGSIQTPRAREDYEVAEFNAKLRRLGLWAGRNPVPPWQWPGR